MLLPKKNYKILLNIRSWYSTAVWDWRQTESNNSQRTHHGLLVEWCTPLPSRIMLSWNAVTRTNLNAHTKLNQSCRELVFQTLVSKWPLGHWLHYIILWMRLSFCLFSVSHPVHLSTSKRWQPVTLDPWHYKTFVLFLLAWTVRLFCLLLTTTLSVPADHALCPRDKSLENRESHSRTETHSLFCHVRYFVKKDIIHWVLTSQWSRVLV